MPSNTEIKEYYDNFLGRLKKDHKRPNPRHTYVKKVLKAIIEPKMKVLDIGCGTGITTAFMGECLGAKVTGVDISDKLVEFARENSAHPNVNYIVEDIIKLRIPGEPFDAIVIVDSLEHIPRINFNNFLVSIIKHSSENTIIYLNIPDGRYQRYIRNNYPDKLQIIDEDYDLDFIISRFEDAGFYVTDLYIYGLDAPVQYNGYIFITDQRLKNAYKKALEGVKS